MLEQGIVTPSESPCTAPVLVQADETKPYLGRTDASRYVIGAVLVQGEGSEETAEERRKTRADTARQPDPQYDPGDLVMVSTHPISRDGFSAKLAPRRDGPYAIQRRHGPASYAIALQEDPDRVVGIYHASALMPFRSRSHSATPQPVAVIRQRGRPKKKPPETNITPTQDEPDAVSLPSTRRRRRQRGRM